jgi:hypothetical protein
MFDRSRLHLKPLSERIHDLEVSVVREPHGGDEVSIRGELELLRQVARRILAARGEKASVILMMGAHVIRSGVQRYIIDLMERGFISCIAMNGACIIHDFELAMAGATTESVARYVKSGEFGLWKETGILNDIINRAFGAVKGIGMGRAVGRAISEGDYPHKEVSLLAAGYRLGIPVTVHVALGCDIIHELPNCDGAATGALTYNDFLTLASVVQNLESGVVMNFGSAVMAPEVFLKALSMARNVAHQQGKAIRRFSTLVCDLHDLPRKPSHEPAKHDPYYYFRPWKTMLVRTVAEGGESFYVRGRHEDTLPALWAAIGEEEKRSA